MLPEHEITGIFLFENLFCDQNLERLRFARDQADLPPRN